MKIVKRKVIEHDLYCDCGALCTGSFSLSLSKGIKSTVNTDCPRCFRERSYTGTGTDFSKFKMTSDMPSRMFDRKEAEFWGKYWDGLLDPKT